MSPWTDLTSSGESHVSNAEVDPILDAPYIEEMISNYTRQKAAAATEEERKEGIPAPADLADPFVSPLFGDFSGFPPTYIQAGENEILLSDSTRLHAKMVEENVSVKLDIFKGMWHVFQMSPLKISHDAMDKNAEFIYDICR